MSEDTVSNKEFSQLIGHFEALEKRLSSAELEIVQHRSEITVLCEHIRRTHGDEMLNQLLEAGAAALELEHEQNIEAHAAASDNPAAYKQHWDERTRHLTRSIRERIL